MKMKVIIVACAWMVSVQASDAGREQLAAGNNEAFQAWVNSVASGMKQLADRQNVLAAEQIAQAQVLGQLDKNQQTLLSEMNTTRRAVGVLDTMKVPGVSKFQNWVVGGSCAAVVSYMTWQVVIVSQCCPWA